MDCNRSSPPQECSRQTTSTHPPTRPRYTHTAPYPPSNATSEAANKRAHEENRHESGWKHDKRNDRNKPLRRRPDQRNRFSAGHGWVRVPCNPFSPASISSMRAFPALDSLGGLSPDHRRAEGYIATHDNIRGQCVASDATRNHPPLYHDLETYILTKVPRNRRNMQAKLNLAGSSARHYFSILPSPPSPTRPRTLEGTDVDTYTRSTRYP